MLIKDVHSWQDIIQLVIDQWDFFIPMFLFGCLLLSLSVYAEYLNMKKRRNARLRRRGRRMNVR